MPINYDLRKIGFYVGVTALLFAIGYFINTGFTAVDLLLKTLLILVFVWIIIKRDLPLQNIPFVSKIIKHKS